MKPRLEIKNGHWWALLDETEGVRTWAPIGKVEKLGDMKEVMGCLRLARWYLAAGILSQITGPIIKENGTEVTEVIPLEVTP